MVIETLAHFEMLGAEIYSVFFLTIGTVMLIGFLKIFGGKRFKKYAFMVGAGMFLFAVLHEMGEVVCLSGIHGGFPETIYGSIHIILLCSIGSIIFFIGCFMFEREYSKYIKS
ncbi:MAG: hypothetical protein ABIE55_04150 [Candidatus Aenigmatarchaeota archaeon]